MNLKELIEDKVFKDPLSKIDTESPCLINTINAHSYCLAVKDELFANSLLNSNILLPDGISIVLASKLLGEGDVKKIAGNDIHQYLLEKAEEKCLKIFYLGASKNTLNLIKNRIKSTFKKIEVESYSPLYKDNFSSNDSDIMIDRINQFKPDILFVGMTAPKQEKWVYLNKDRINSNMIVSIGAVFDFYAGNVKRAPNWMIKYGFEWLYRLVKEPKRMWKRYLINNTKFIYYCFNEKFHLYMNKVKN